MLKSKFLIKNMSHESPLISYNIKIYDISNIIHRLS